MVDHVESPIVEKCRELIETHQDHKAKVRLQLFYCDLLPSGKLGVIHHLTCLQIGLVNNMLENSQTEEQLENLRDCSWNGSGWPSCLCEWLHSLLFYPPLLRKHELQLQRRMFAASLPTDINQASVTNEG